MKIKRSLLLLLLVALLALTAQFSAVDGAKRKHHKGKCAKSKRKKCGKAGSLRMKGSTGGVPKVPKVVPLSGAGSTKLPSGCKGGGQGAYCVIRENAGLASMHTIPTMAGTVILINRNDVQEQIFLNGQNPKKSLGAHAVEYTLSDNSIRPLTLTTNTLCSSGGTASDGTVYSLGGHDFGVIGARKFVPCTNKKCDIQNGLESLKGQRWYGSTITIEDGRLLIMGGNGGSAFNNAKANTPTYEFYPPYSPNAKPVFLQFLVDTLPSNLYPMINLLPSGNLLVFANQDSIILDYKQNKVLKKLPKLLGGVRSYRHSTGSTLLPLRASEGFKKVEFLICGGAPELSCGQNDVCLASKTKEPAIKDCGRINLGCWGYSSSCATTPQWTHESLNLNRVMGDNVLLPDGNVLIVNGAQNGHAGYRAATNPAYNAELYYTQGPFGKRIQLLAKSKIGRGYHSTANLIPDGRVFIAGSNPRSNYSFSYDPVSTPIPSSLTIEAFYPPYFFQGPQPVIYKAPAAIQYGKTFTVTFGAKSSANVKVVLHAPAFVTHATNMNQRQVELAITGWSFSGGLATITVFAPPSKSVAPPQPYMLFVVQNGIPAVKASWVKLA